jgi:hypothetical protein
MSGGYPIVIVELALPAMIWSAMPRASAIVMA